LNITAEDIAPFAAAASSIIVAAPSRTNSNPFVTDTFIAINSMLSSDSRSFPSLILRDADLHPSSAAAFVVVGCLLY